MTDIYSPEKRSHLMSGIRSTATGPELRVRDVAQRLGYDHSTNRADLPGKPDLVFENQRKVVFVHGCFWHVHPGCSKARPPRTNSDFWDQKLSQNVRRDQKNLIALEELSWHSLVVWECETRDLDSLSRRLEEFLRGSSN